jgi:pyridoxine 5-phosphate synthase
MNLNVNIDHIATLRNARGVSEPEPIAIALMAELAGATGIVCHLREDRRHIKDQDVYLLRKLIKTKLDLEMAATEELINIALDVKPELVTIVPEKRMELTTEGGLNIAADIPRFTSLCDIMHSSGIEVSFFVEPEIGQIQASHKCGADMVELHTGVYANLCEHKQLQELFKIEEAANFADGLGMKVAAGHGLNYFNTKPVAKISTIHELSIGHSIISRSVFYGIDEAVRTMLHIMND